MNARVLARRPAAVLEAPQIDVGTSGVARQPSVVTGPPSVPLAARSGSAAGCGRPDARRSAVAEMRAGCDDAAWHQARRDVGTGTAKWYKQGYAGGMVFRQKQTDPGARDAWEPVRADQAG